MDFNIKNEFIRKVLVYFVGNLSTRLLSVIMVPIYAYYVQVKELGEYDYITAITGIATPIVYCAIWESILKYGILKRKKGENVNSVFSTALMFLIWMTLASLFFCAIHFVLFKSLIYVIYIFLLILVQGSCTLWQFSTRALGESKIYVQSSILGSVVMIFLDIFFIVFYTLDFNALVISYILSQISIIISLELKCKLFVRFSKVLISRNLLRIMIIFSFPLVINNISLWLYNGGSKIIIKNFIGAEANGMYSFASKFSMLISLFSSVLSMAVIEQSYSYKSLDDYKKQMSNIIANISKWYFSLIAISLPFLYILYSLLFIKTDYFPSRDYILYLLLGALFTSLSNNFGSSFQVTDNTRKILYTTISGAALSLIFSLITVETLGIYGVLIGGAIGPLLMMLLRSFYAKKTTGLKIKWRENLFILTFVFVEYVFLYNTESIFVMTSIATISVITILLFYRKELSMFYHN